MRKMRKDISRAKLALGWNQPYEGRMLSHTKLLIFDNFYHKIGQVFADQLNVLLNPELLQAS